jgi:hypothetical protein
MISPSDITARAETTSERNFHPVRRPTGDSARSDERVIAAWSAPTKIAGTVS